MKKLKCEMCGGSDILKEEGVYVCQNCGTKYSTEEAKKMMVEGVVEVKGKVKIDQADSISNYLTMANTAYEAGNLKEAENYCNKMIEIDLNHCDAWLLKGKAAGWQSTVGNKRFAESIKCFEKAIKNSPKEKKEEIATTSLNEISQLANALVTACCNNFVERPSSDNAISITKNLNVSLDSILNIMKVCVDEEIDLDFEEYRKKELKMMKEIDVAIRKGWDNVLIEFQGDNNRPNHYDYDRYLDRGRACFIMMEFIASNTESKYVTEEEEKVTIKIDDVEENKDDIEKTIMELLKIKAAEAKEMMDCGILKENVLFSEANTIKEKLEEAGATIQLVSSTGEEITNGCRKIADPEIKDFLIDLYKKIIEMRTHYMNSCCFKKEYNQYGSYWAVDLTLTNEAKAKCVEEIKKYHNKIHDLDPNYVVPTNVRPQSNHAGCGTVVVIIIILIILYVFLTS